MAYTRFCDHFVIVNHYVSAALPLKIPSLRLTGTASPSSMVSGIFLCCVSGRKRARTPAAKAVTPKMTMGNVGSTICQIKKNKFSHFQNYHRRDSWILNLGGSRCSQPYSDVVWVFSFHKISAVQKPKQCLLTIPDDNTFNPGHACFQIFEAL